MVVIHAIINMGRLSLTSPRIVIADPPRAILQSSFTTRLPIIGFGVDRGLGSVRIAFSESLYEGQVVPCYPTFFQITQNDGVRAKSNIKTKFENILMEGGQVLKHVPLNCWVRLVPHYSR